MLIAVLGRYSVWSLIESILSDLMMSGRKFRINKKTETIDDVAKVEYESTDTKHLSQIADIAFKPTARTIFVAHRNPFLPGAFDNCPSYCSL